MHINDLTIAQRIKLLGVLSQDFGTPDSELRKQIISTFKPEPIQETKEETFEDGEVVGVIKVTKNHGFKVGDTIKISSKSQFDGYYVSYNSKGAAKYVPFEDIKKLPKPNKIDKDELRKHLEAVRSLWITTSHGISTCIDKYIDTL